MKSVLLASILAFSIPAFSHDHDHSNDPSILNKSRVTLATSTALELFEAGQVGHLWSFATVKEDDEATAKILYVDNNNQARTSGYDCHFHTHGNAEEAHCHDAGDVSITAAPNAPLTFPVDAFLSALENALDTFERKIAPLDKITAVKMWQFKDEIYASLIHDGTAGSVSSHFMCHLHDGVHIDCHRSRNPGPQEPKF